MSSSDRLNRVYENCDYVVRVKDAYKFYESNSENYGVLCGLNISIRRNSMYVIKKT